MSRREDNSDYDSNCNCNKCIKKRETRCNNIRYEQNRCKKIRYNNCSCKDCCSKRNKNECRNNSEYCNNNNDNHNDDIGKSGFC